MNELIRTTADLLNEEKDFPISAVRLNAMRDLGKVSLFVESGRDRG